MDNPSSNPAARACTAFVGSRLLLAGALIDVALAVKAASHEATDPILLFDDATGRVIDLDLRGSKADILARLPTIFSDGVLSPSPRDEPAEPAQSAEKRGRGRPKLGVVPREVTLLPRHWDWLAAQPGGASVTLRRLVDEARRSGASSERQREAREAAYRFMSAIAGNMPGFEEAARALFAGDAARFGALVAAWPEAVAAYARKLAADGFVSRVQSESSLAPPTAPRL
jgi:hypothetical protein